MNTNNTNAIEDNIWSEGATTGFEMFPECYNQSEDETTDVSKNQKTLMQHKQLTPQRYPVVEDFPVPPLSTQPQWMQKFNKNFLSIEEADWVSFLNDVVPDTNNTAAWFTFNNDEESIGWARQLLDYLSSARADTFIRVVYYRKWLKERVWYLALIYNKQVLKRLENPTYDDSLILHYFYE